MGNDQAEDFEKAILLSFAQDGQVEESLKVIHSATIILPSMRGRFWWRGSGLLTLEHVRIHFAIRWYP